MQQRDLPVVTVGVDRTQGFLREVSAWPEEQAVAVLGSPDAVGGMEGVVSAVPAQASWRERLWNAANGYLEAAVSHPVVGAEAGRRSTGGPGELAMLELLLATLTEAGLTTEQVVRHYPLLAGYVASTATALREQVSGPRDEDVLRPGSDHARRGRGVR